jgi:hypothetical protein
VAEGIAFGHPDNPFSGQAMLRYVIRRLLQAIPLLFIISIILFVLMQNMGDPLATLGGRQVTRSEDRQRLARQLGLDQPLYMQYLYWLIGNDWTKMDLDGDGVPETPGRRKGVLRGDFGVSLVAKKPVVQVIWDRLPNTLLLMGVTELVIIVGSLVIGMYSALRQYSFLDHLITAISFIGYSMPIFFVALLSMYIFAVNFKRWGLPYLPTVGMFDPQVGKTPGQVALHMVLPVFSLSFILHLQRDVRGAEPGLHPHRARQRAAPPDHHLHPRAEERLAPHCDRRRAGPAFPAGGGHRHRTDFRLARYGPSLPGPRLPGRHAGGHGHPDDDCRRRSGLPDSDRYCVRVVGPQDTVRVVEWVTTYQGTSGQAP